MRTARRQYDEAKLPSTHTSPLMKRIIELLTDTNLSYSDIDIKLMEEFPHLVEEGWKVGSMRKKVKKYPIFGRTAKESRALIWRELGRSKKDGFKVFSDAIDANQVAADGTERPDHKTRMEASKAMLALMGENTSPQGAKINMSLGTGDNKIMIVTSDGKQLDDVV